MSKLRNILLSGAMATTLTACGGGGGGGGAVGTVSNFIQNDVSTLSGSNTIVSSYSSLLSNFNTTIAGGDFGGLQAVITGPDAEDISTANTLLSQLQTAETLWANTETLIAQQSDADKFRIYNSASYKEAYAAMIYLRDHVKPIITRVSEGKTITLEQLNKVAKEDKAQEIINTEKETTASTYAESKKIKQTIERKSTTEIYNQIEDGTPTSSFSGEGTTSWAPIEGAGGKEERTYKVTTPQTRVVKTEVCTWTDIVKLTEEGSSTEQANKSCSTTTESTELAPKSELVKEQREGDNPVVTTEILPDVVSEPVTEWNSSYGTNGTLTVTEEKSRVANEPEITAGAESTATIDYTKTRTEETGTKNQVWVIVDNWTKTTVTKPAVSTPSENVTTEITKTKQKRTWTITTKKKKVTYKDGTSEIIETPQAKEYTAWETIQTSQTTETNKVEGTPTDIFLTPDITDVFVSQASKTLKNNAYTNDDVDLGTKTANLSTNPDDHKTTEFNYSKVNSMINADKAYARGWTGKGAVLGVIDSYQDTEHKDLDGKYKWYKDYVWKSDTVENRGQYVSHGTQVSGIIAAHKDGEGIHGVAYDAELVGANIDYYGNGSAHMGQAEKALHDIVKLKSTEAQGGEAMNIVAVNMSFNKGRQQPHYGTITQLEDGTFSSSVVTNRMEDGGGAKYWKIGTDNDIVLVNSAGNGMYMADGTTNYDFSLDPGIYATETDSNGDLVLGGKMIIVGNWGGTKEDGQVVGSKSGHVCLDIVANKCNDQYQVKDFYILAPGFVDSTTPQDGYAINNGSSFSAPQVTGAMGILHQMWPHMKGENLVKLVLNTADKDINGYDENIHGQGMLDLDEATKPQGAIGLPTTGRVDGATSTKNLNNTYFATGSASAFSGISDLKIMVLDDYDRDYYMNLGSSFTVKDNRKYSDIDMLMNNNNAFLPINQSFGSFTQGGQYNLINNYNFGMYSGENGGGDYSLNVGKNFMLNKNLKLKTSVGQMSEQDTWLGNYSDGALAVGDNNNTNFGNIGIEYALGNNVLSLDYTKGKTDINTTDGSLIKNFSDVETESYRLAYEIHKDTHTTFGWSFSLPSHITSGSMDLEVAESVNMDGTINYKNINSDLTQGTKEKNFGFFYNKTSDNDLDASFNFSAEYRQDIAGQDGMDGINLGLNYVKKFSGACGFLFWKNPKCYNEDGSKKDMKALYAAQGKKEDSATALGLKYDLEKDMFVPINPDDPKWKK